MKGSRSLLAMAIGLTAAQAQVTLNEIYINPPGTDNGTEFVEIRTDAPSTPLTGIWFVGIEGDGPAAGVVDFAYDLSAFSTGSNGYLLIRDAATVLAPAPAAATSIAVQDFAPDIENGSNTYLLVRGFTGSVGLDLDAENDGTLESTPWTATLDGVSLIENDGTANIGYAAQFGYTVFTAQTTFNADALFRVEGGGWAGADTLGTVPGPFTIDATRAALAGGAPVEMQGTLTPGSANAVAVVPEPATLALFALGGLGLLALRRR